MYIHILIDTKGRQDSWEIDILFLQILDWGMVPITIQVLLLLRYATRTGTHKLTSGEHSWKGGNNVEARTATTENKVPHILF